MLGWSRQFLLEEITYDEYAGWLEYFRRYPEGWRDDLRTYYMMSSSAMGGMKKKPEQIFPSIKAVMRAEADRPAEEVAAQTLKASVFGQMFNDANNKTGE